MRVLLVNSQGQAVETWSYKGNKNGVLDDMFKALLDDEKDTVSNKVVDGYLGDVHEVV